MLLLGLSVFTACEKTEGADDPIDASKSRLLQDGKWQMKAYTINPNIYDSLMFPEDQYANLPGCRRDDYAVFSATTFTRYENYTKCAPEMPESTEYYYALENNENYLRVWAIADDPTSVILAGDMTYPSLDTFILTYQVFDEDSEWTSEHVQTYVKIP